ncbi:DNA cytosine methyltransferase [Cellulosimicrobium sp. SH8]|uniref:DNA cytosine methyltransferase n=1 Tax=Cellulosimicrobium sp. SH8 TaxID=2952936 RepID=UPI0021F2BC7C|nr:DNA cytosine methyltransferase [Cellulosimicrobium sp. SH8]
MSNLTMTDLFCGAGGSSTGAVSVPGVSVRLAANHWDRAIETHNTNHPDVDHLQADISNTDPRYVPTTDILWASPECTNHSRAKGRKAHRQPDLFGDVLPDEAAERSRATMWDVVRFAETHHYRAVLVENVVEVVDWSAEWGVKGGLFQSWLGAMHAMGYRHHIVSMNSMHAQGYGLPAPQSRDRVYIAFWRAGERAPDFERMQRPRAYCPRCDEVVDAMQWWKKGDGKTRPGRYRSQYLYRCPNVACRNEVVEPAWLPASSIIDWSNPGTRIGDRDKPLAEKTMRRIQVGIERYWSPILAENGGNPYDAADPKHPGFGNPASYYRAWPITDPTQTMHTRESKGLAYHPLMVPAGGTWNDRAKPTGDVMTTRTTRETDGLAFPPFLAELRGGGSTARAASDPLATVTASGNHHGLVMPYYGTGRTAPTDEALSTVTTLARHALIHRHNNNRGDQSAMTTPSSEPVRTITTSGHQSVLAADRPTVNIDDVRFRMLEPDEIKQAMAFPADYVMVGNRREQVKLSGNAVTPPTARDLVATVAAAITGEDVAA